jgi:hypothetical protein
MHFFVNNPEKFQSHQYTRSGNARNKHHIQGPVANLSCFQKSAFRSGIRIFNNLPRSLTNLKTEWHNLK